MPTIATALNTPFGPQRTEFIVQVTGGKCRLERRNTSGAAWAPIMREDDTVWKLSGAHVVPNPVSGAQYQLIAIEGTPVIQADEA